MYKVIYGANNTYGVNPDAKVNYLALILIDVDLMNEDACKQKEAN